MKHTGEKYNFTSQTSIRYNSVFSRLSSQIQAFQSQNEAKASIPCKILILKNGFALAGRFVFARGKSSGRPKVVFFPGLFFLVKDYGGSN